MLMPGTRAWCPGMVPEYYDFHYALMWTHCFSKTHTRTLAHCPFPGTGSHSYTKWYLDTWIASVWMEHYILCRCEYRFTASYLYILYLSLFWAISFLFSLFLWTMDNKIYCICTDKVIIDIQHCKITAEFVAENCWETCHQYLICFKFVVVLCWPSRDSVTLCDAKSSMQTFAWDLQMSWRNSDVSKSCVLDLSQTPYFTWAKSAANEKNPLFSLIGAH